MSVPTGGDQMIERQKAADVKQDLLAVAWRDFLIWAIGEPDMLLQYERATGKKLLGNKLIDVNSIHYKEDLEKESFREFTIWATKTYWGEDAAPPQYHKWRKRGSPS